MASQFSKWLVTKKGKTFTSVCAALATGGSAFISFSPHWCFIDKYQELVQLYKHGIPVKLDSNLNALAEEELAKCSFLSEKVKGFVSFFMVSGFDMFHAGSAELNNGSIVGLPKYLTYESKDDIDEEDIRVQNNPVKWHSQHGKNLASSILLSEQAKRFAITREFYYLKKNPLVVSTNLCLSMCAVLSGCSYLNRRLNLLSQARYLRFSIYGFISSIMAVSFMALYDSYNVLYDKWADEELAKLGKSTVEGGIEFYGKLMLKNSALHHILGSNGGNWYTMKGNYNCWIRTPTLPPEQRLQFFKNKLQEIDSQDNDNKVLT